MKSKTAILGAGAWGTALAIQLARCGGTATLWGHRPEHVAELARSRENARYLPGARFPDNLQLEPALDAALEGADFALVAVPSKAFVDTVAAVAPLTAAPVFWATKGLDAESGRPLHEHAARLLGSGRGMGVISGPSFAREVAAGMPTAVTVAATDMALARRFASRVHGATFRAYVSTDLVGVELGGAAKNVIAIAAGIADGMGLGANARAGLITRGLAELRRLGKALGARPQTLIGLSGLGDLVLTATDNQSRNRRFGIALGEGQPLEDARDAIGGAVEGIPAARAIMRLAESVGVELPICAQVRAVVHGDQTPRDAVGALMARAMKSER